MDRVDSAVRSRIMSRIRGKNTKPEIQLRKAVFAEGVRFRVHNRSVLGTPDISHKGAKVAVFVDGCFWHGCPTHYSRPRSRQTFWDNKLAYNRDLRARVLNGLASDSWHVVQVWECSVRSNAKQAAGDIARAVNQRRPVK
jgi:DNA mismatch endonuclease (patch repair protein)